MLCDCRLYAQKMTTLVALCDVCTAIVHAKSRASLVLTLLTARVSGRHAGGISQVVMEVRVADLPVPRPDRQVLLELRPFLLKRLVRVRRCFRRRHLRTNPDFTQKRLFVLRSDVNQAFFGCLMMLILNASGSFLQVSRFYSCHRIGRRKRQ